MTDRQYDIKLAAIGGRVGGWEAAYQQEKTPP